MAERVGLSKVDGENLILLESLYEIFHSLEIARRRYTNFPFVFHKKVITRKEFYHVLQKEVNAHAGIWSN